MHGLLIFLSIGSLGLATITDTTPLPDSIWSYLSRFGIEGLFIAFAGFCFYRLLDFLTKVLVPRFDAMIKNQAEIVEKLHKLTEGIIGLPCVNKKDEKV